MMTTTVMPCSVAVFTIGLLLLAFLAQGQPARHSVPLPLGAHRLFQSLHAQRFPKTCYWERAHRACHLYVLKNYLSRTCHKETKLGARLDKLVPYPHLYSGRGTAQHTLLPSNERIKK